MTRLTGVTITALIGLMLVGLGGCPTDSAYTDGFIDDGGYYDGYDDSAWWTDDPNYEDDFDDLYGDDFWSDEDWDDDFWWDEDPNTWDWEDPNGLYWDDPNEAGTDDGTDGGEDTVGVQTQFDEVWDNFDRYYSYFSYKSVDWNALRDKYRPDFAADLGSDAFAEKLAQMLAELRDRHIVVQKPDGTYVEVYSPDVTLNYTSTPRNRYAPGGYQTLGDNVVWHGWLENNIAYIRVDTLTTGAFSGISDADIEALFANYAGAAGMIIDIRPNNGGDERIAAKFAGHFTDTARVYGYTEKRNGAGHDECGARETSTLQPASGNLFLKPTVCLIGKRCMSSAEWFTLMMDVCPNVTLIGDTTRGSSGDPQGFSLSNGVNYTVSTWIAYTYTGAHIEDVGITPDIQIAAESSFDGEHDYVVEQAIAVLTGE
ncbi:MAG: S41 family peptidase [Phycisphaerae bacterium]|nr:S41 family peptidase [Phycisphaerae bacterium]